MATPTRNNAFSRAARLTNKHEFGRVFARPRVAQDRYFRVLSRSNGLDRSRLGMAVSIKVCKQAPGRNRLKRLIRESFRHHQGDLAKQGGRDFVVLPRPQAATICNPTLNDALAKLWRRSLKDRADTSTRTPQRES